MRNWFDYDLGALVVLAIGICGVATLAFNI
jgi:hypothetical protein